MPVRVRRGFEPARPVNDEREDRGVRRKGRGGTRASIVVDPGILRGQGDDRARGRTMSLAVRLPPRSRNGVEGLADVVCGRPGAVLVLVARAVESSRKMRPYPPVPVIV